MRRTALLLGFLLATACQETPRPEAKVSEVFPALPLPPKADMLSREGGEEALKLRFRSRATVDEVAQYYREVFNRGGWSLVSDTPIDSGGVALYAEQQGGQPLWVQIHKDAGTDGSLVDLAGAKAQ